MAQGTPGDGLELVTYPDAHIPGRADVLAVTSESEPIIRISRPCLLILQQPPTGAGSKNVVFIRQVINVGLNQPCILGEGC